MLGLRLEMIGMFECLQCLSVYEIKTSFAWVSLNNIANSRKTTVDGVDYWECTAVK